jgi:hypothetical protein
MSYLNRAFNPELFLRRGTVALRVTKGDEK